MVFVERWKGYLEKNPQSKESLDPHNYGKRLETNPGHIGGSSTASSQLLITLMSFQLFRIILRARGLNFQSTEVHLPLLPFCRPQSLLPAVFSIRSNWFPTRCKSQEVYQQHPIPAITTDTETNQFPSCLLNFSIHLAQLDFYYTRFVCLLDNSYNEL